MLAGLRACWPAARLAAAALLPLPPPLRGLRPSRLACAAAANAPQQGKQRDASSGAQLIRKKKRRLDEVCLERHPEHSRNVIQSWIAQGKVLVNDQPVLKAGAQVSEAAAVTIIAEQPRFVCRAGLKLEAALDEWGIDVTGKTVLDAGLSTGGFTDCLLQRGAAGVVGVDVGYGQVAERVRVHPQVRVMERTNLRTLRLADLLSGNGGGSSGGSRGGVQVPAGGVDLVTLDLSFISATKVLDAVCDVLRPGGELVLLIKPQFEAGKEQVSAGGVVRDPAVHAQVLERVVGAVEARGFGCAGWRPSPIKGAAAGNTEFLAYFKGFDKGAASAASGDSSEGTEDGGSGSSKAAGTEAAAAAAAEGTAAAAADGPGGGSGARRGQRK